MTSRITTSNILLFFVGLFCITVPLFGIHGEDLVVTIDPNEVLDQALDNNSALGAIMALQCGADVHRKNPGGFLPLCVAAGHCSPEMLKILIDAGADPNAADDTKSRPLCEAARHLRLENVEFLLERGADINGEGAANRTPLSFVLGCMSSMDEEAFASRNQQAYEIALLLLANGASPYLKTVPYWWHYGEVLYFLSSVQILIRSKIILARRRPLVDTKSLVTGLIVRDQSLA